MSQLSGPRARRRPEAGEDDELEGERGDAPRAPRSVPPAAGDASSDRSSTRGARAVVPIAEDISLFFAVLNLWATRPSRVVRGRSQFVQWPWTSSSAIQASSSAVEAAERGRPLSSPPPVGDSDSAGNDDTIDDTATLAGGCCMKLSIPIARSPDRVFVFPQKEGEKRRRRYHRIATEPHRTPGRRGHGKR